jgi:hypothetical protein
MSPEAGPIVAPAAPVAAVQPAPTEPEPPLPAATPANVESRHEAAAPAPDRLQHGAVTGPACANCGFLVAGHYCGNCGQRFEHSVHSVWHFTREATEDLTHADSRLWRTLFALAFKPGFLTQEFLAGRRARYLPPLRLYLVLSVIFFLAIGSMQHEVRFTNVKTAKGKTASVTVVRPEEFSQQRVCTDPYEGPAKSFVQPFLTKACRSFTPDRTGNIAEAFIHNAARAMFLFLPVMALVMKPMYWRPRRYYVEHLLFFVHNHAFVFLALALISLIDSALPAGLAKDLGPIIWLYVAYYLFVAMRKVYGQSRPITFAKFTVLSFAYFSGIAAMLVLTGVYSVWSL